LKTKTKELVTNYGSNRPRWKEYSGPRDAPHTDIEKTQGKANSSTELRAFEDAAPLPSKRPAFITELSQLHHELKTIATENNGRSALTSLNDLRVVT